MLILKYIFLKIKEKKSVYPYTNFQDIDPCLVFSTYLFRESLKEFEIGNKSTNSVKIFIYMSEMDKVCS